MGQKIEPAPDLSWRPRACMDTETGELYEPRWITHKDLNPDANEFDAGLFDAGCRTRSTT
jgi:hypothetical protein